MRSRVAALRLVTATLLVLAPLTPSGFAAAADTPAAAPAAAQSGVHLDREASGATALTALGADLERVAAAHGKNESQLARAFKDDESLWVDRQGKLLYREKPASGAPEAGSVSAAATTPFPLDQTFKLHSRAGAKRTIYLDFDGHVMTNSGWNSYNDGNTIVAPAWNTDAAPETFGDAERTAIQQMWQRVAEDYAPFDVDVTTELTSEDILYRSSSSDLVFGQRILVSAISTYFGHYGGISYVGVFDGVGSRNPSLVFPENLSNNEKYIAEAASHECGHAVGLLHDGTTSGTEYYSGHGTGATSWAPIMGSGYSRSVSQWSKGEYALANNTEDDLVVMQQNGLTYRLDDHGNSAVSSSSIAGPALAASGAVERTGDVDVVSFDAGAGPLSVSVNPWARGANLDIALELRDESGALIASSNPVDALNAAITATVAGGRYSVAVKGTGKGDLSTGYSAYASLGVWSLSGSVVAPVTSTPPTAAISASPPQGVAPLLVTFDGTASHDPDGSIVSWAWEFGDGSNGSGATATHSYSAPGSYTARLTVTDSAGLTASTTTTIVATAPKSAPTAVIGATPTQGQAPLAVSFNGSSSFDPDGSVAGYAWNFGDGTTASGVSASHTYTAAGVYTAYLTVTDNEGLTATASRIITCLAPNVAPTAVALASPSSGTAPLPVAFDGSASTDGDGAIVSYAWDFGDGANGTGARPSHTYTAAGSYTARLTVTDDRGGTGTSSVAISVAPQVLPKMRVGSINLTLVTVRRTKTARAAILVTDAGGSPVSGATVNGTWSGVVTGSASALTGSNGVATLSSKPIKRSGTVSIAVTQVAKASNVYDPTLNAATSASISASAPLGATRSRLQNLATLSRKML